MAVDNGQQTPKYRVKVYHLLDDGTWVDKGTGLLGVTFSAENGLVLTCRAEACENTQLVRHQIDASLTYELQNKTIISWSTQTEEFDDIAVSFLHPTDCAGVWEAINTICGTGSFLSDGGGEEEEEEGEVVVLPKLTPQNCNVETLQTILTVLAKANGLTFGNPCRNQVEREALNDAFLQPLLSSIEVLESKADFQGLDIVFQILMRYVLMNVHMAEKIFLTRNFQRALGGLEYNSHRSNQGRLSTKHRDFLKSSRMNKAIELPDGIEELAVTLFQIIYVRDSVLWGFIDDLPSCGLTLLVKEYTMEVCNSLVQHQDFLPLLFSKMMGRPVVRDSVKKVLNFEDSIDLSFDTSVTSEIECSPHSLIQPSSLQKRKIFFDFLKELLVRTDLLNANDKLLVCQQMSHKGLFEMFVFVMDEADPKIHDWFWFLLISVLKSWTELDIDDLRQCSSSRPIVSKLFDVACTSGISTELRGQVFDFIKTMFDFPQPEPEGLSTPGYERIKSLYLTSLYDHYIQKVYTSLNSMSNDPSVNSLRSTTCDFLSHLLIEQPIYMKISLEHNFRIFDRIFGGSPSSLIQSRKTNEVLSAIRFLRKVIGTDSHKLLTFIASDNLLNPCMKIFIENGSKPNMISSVVSEMIQYIVARNHKCLLLQIYSRYFSKLQRVLNKQIFENLCKIYQHNIDDPSFRPQPMPHQQLDLCKSPPRTPAGSRSRTPAIPSKFRSALGRMRLGRASNSPTTKLGRLSFKPDSAVKPEKENTPPLNLVTAGQLFQIHPQQTSSSQSSLIKEEGKKAKKLTPNLKRSALTFDEELELKFSQNPLAVGSSPSPMKRRCNPNPNGSSSSSAAGGSGGCESPLKKRRL